MSAAAGVAATDSATAAPREGTVMAFDFGERRIGVATGSTNIRIAHPLEMIDAEANDARFARIGELLREWQPVQLVVGLPTHLDGSEHELTRLARKFAQRLDGRFGLPVALVDERLTSAEAESRLNEIGVRGRSQKAHLDAVAAQSILQSWFDQHS